MEVHPATMAHQPSTPPASRGLTGQRPLPSSPFRSSVAIPASIEEVPSSSRRGSNSSQPSNRSSGHGSEDVDMANSGEEGHDDDGTSDAESDTVEADGTRTRKKKKSLKFFCTNYPPCNLSFTRSEHLARHIRKHTGERPFQCHCSRKFSRLDNLRQHAQTVHVNEDIPMDSLAATGTRYQRQVRTERIRSPRRARASTAGSLEVPARGHGKSLSTSNIGSGASSFNFNSLEDPNRSRPPPIVMNEPPHGYYPYPGSARGHSPSEYDYSTPPSSTFSTAQNSTAQSSPGWSSLASPTSSHSRSHSMYAAGARAQPSGRRLSVPSSQNPFQYSVTNRAPPANQLYPIFQGPTLHSNGPPPSGPAPSAAPSGHSRAASSSNADEAWRRRTWHSESTSAPGNANPAPGSRLSNVVTSAQLPSPAAESPANGTSHQSGQQGNSVKLPGIASFFRGPPSPAPSAPRTLAHRPASPSRHPQSAQSSGQGLHPPVMSDNNYNRRSLSTWDLSLHRGLTRTEAPNSTTPPRDGAGAWAQEANRAMEAEADRVRVAQPTVRFNEPVVVHHGPSRRSSPGRPGHQYTMSAPMVASRDPRESRRRAWHYMAGPQNDANAERAARAERMIHPNIDQFPGFPAREAADPRGGEETSDRLNTLVNAAARANGATR